MSGMWEEREGEGKEGNGDFGERGVWRLGWVGWGYPWRWEMRGLWVDWTPGVMAPIYGF